MTIICLPDIWLHLLYSFNLQYIEELDCDDLHGRDGLRICL